MKIIKKIKNTEKRRSCFDQCNFLRERILNCLTTLTLKSLVKPQFKEAQDEKLKTLLRCSVRLGASKVLVYAKQETHQQ